MATTLLNSARLRRLAADNVYWRRLALVAVAPRNYHFWRCHCYINLNATSTSTRRQNNRRADADCNNHIDIAADRLKHKNIVQLLDIYEDRNRVYLVMEL